MTDREILRGLVRRYLEIVHSDRNREGHVLHRAVNDLAAVRPVVLIDELPWGELDIDGELTCTCRDTALHGLEWNLRSTLYKWRHMPADMIVPPYMAVDKVVHSTGNGLRVDEKTLKSDARHGIVAHEYHDILAREEDLLAIRNPVLTYDEAETMARFQRMGDLVGDLIPVKLRGIAYFGVGTWDQIASYRGVTNLLMDLMDRPAFMHRIVRALTDAAKSQLEQIERLDLFDNDPYSLHCTPALTGDLPGQDLQGGHLTRRNVWGRGAAQIFAQVSSAMHDEFDIAYMVETIGQCGLSYYGCCEPLDTKIDILEKLPNLRKISITPWADVDHAAERIGNRYVLSAKPNPAAVAVAATDPAAIRKEVGRILDACRRHGCACDIVLKDISTCNNRPENVFTWERTVMEMVRNG